MSGPPQIKEIKILKQRAVITNPGTKTPIYIPASVVKNHCLRTPGPWRGENLICAFFAGPRCHKEFHFPLFIYLYFTDGSCSSPLPRAPAPQFFRLPRSEIRLNARFLLEVCTRHSQPRFNLLRLHRLRGVVFRPLR